MIKVYKYGLTAIEGFDEFAQGELRRMNDLWNKLVELDRARLAQFRAACREHVPDYRDADDELQALKPDIDALFDEIKQQRIKNRSKEVDAALAVRKDALLGKRRELADQLKKAQKQLPKPAQQVINEDFKAAVKLARQTSGCWWPNYNAIILAFEAARGKKGVAHFKPFDGTGRFCNQIQYGISTADFLAGKCSQVKPDAPVRTKPNKHPLVPVDITAFTYADANNKRQRHFIRAHVVYHRPLPEDGVIKSIETVISEGGKGKQWHICLTVSLPDAPAHAKGNIGGVNLNFRKVGDSLRVATAVDADGRSRHYYLPAPLVQKFMLAEQLQGENDDAYNALVDYIRDNFAYAEGELTELAKRIVASKKVPPEWLTALRNAWPDAGFAELLRVYDRKRRSYTGCRRKAAAHRDALYQVFAREIAQSYAHICVNDLPLAQLNRVKNKDGLAVDNELSELPRKYRTIAGLSVLKDWLGKQVAKAGGTLEVLKDKVTQTCSSCGHVQKKKPVEIEFVCEKCGTRHDIDVNAGKNCIQFALGTVEKPVKQTKFERVKAYMSQQNQQVG